MKIKLSSKWVKYLLSKPESGMGYQVVDITLENGRIVKGVNVFNGEDIELNDEYKSIKIDEIIKIELSKK